MRREYSTIVEIGNYLVSSEILTEKYCCDYVKCKGACCIIGDSGAPLEDNEVDAVAEHYDLFKEYMSPEGRAEIEKSGFYVIDQDGDKVTPLIHEEECAYTRFEGENCLCAMERAYFNGKSDFRKPISCWLYPIRVMKLSNGMTALNLHRWNICRDAFTKGRREGIPVYKFLKEPITQAFGADFYKELEAAEKLLNESMKQ